MNTNSKITAQLGLSIMTLLLLILPTAGKQSKKISTAVTMPQHCMMMKQLQLKLDATTKAQDLRLKNLMSPMDDAFGDQKVRIMSEVIKELVMQRNERQEMRDNMQSHRMGHMMEHMQQGGKMTMKQCPRMVARVGLVSK